jgi:hypothetical protein
MDKRIRPNEICVIGQPSCGFAFSSTRCCFIAYPFEEGAFEVAILRTILERKGIQPVEAGGLRAPGQSAFCAKICSKIITSQFCIIILNNKMQDGVEIPNPNVNMEYGLMLGFNKRVIPFQLSDQSLAFNVSGLDTIKYTSSTFERLASDAIDQAIKETAQNVSVEATSADEVLRAFLVDRGKLYTPLTSEGERDLFNLGVPLGCNLLNDFSGMAYAFLGNFTSLRTESVLWRVRKLDEIVQGRMSSFNSKIAAGMATKAQVELVTKVMDNMEFWIILNSEADRQAILTSLKGNVLKLRPVLFTLEEVNQVQERFGQADSE